MTISAGSLRHLVEFQDRIEVQDPETGAMVTDWATAFSDWAQVSPLSAREFIAAQATQSKVVARIVIRFREDVRPTMRVIHGATVYQVEGVLPDAESGREYLTLPVSTGVREG